MWKIVQVEQLILNHSLIETRGSGVDTGKLEIHVCLKWEAAFSSSCLINISEFIIFLFIFFFHLSMYGVTKLFP